LPTFAKRDITNLSLLNKVGNPVKQTGNASFNFTVFFLLTFLNLIMTTVLISIVLVALAFAGIAIKILVKKNGRFSGTCSSNNPLLQKDGGTCSICGAKPEEKCKS